MALLHSGLAKSGLAGELHDALLLDQAFFLAANIKAIGTIGFGFFIAFVQRSKAIAADADPFAIGFFARRGASGKRCQNGNQHEFFHKAVSFGL